MRRPIHIAVVTIGSAPTARKTKDAEKLIQAALKPSATEPFAEAVKIVRRQHASLLEHALQPPSNRTRGLWMFMDSFRPSTTFTAVLLMSAGSCAAPIRMPM
jgi:hypothetical protein